HLGRSVLTRGDHSRLAELPAKKKDPLNYAAKPLIAAPPWLPNGLLNAVTVAAFNEVWFRKAPRNERGRVEKLATFFHPLDGVGGRGGRTDLLGQGLASAARAVPPHVSGLGAVAEDPRRARPRPRAAVRSVPSLGAHVNEPKARMAAEKHRMTCVAGRRPLAG